MSNSSSFLDLCIKYGYLSNSFRCYNCDDNGKIDLLPYRLLITHRYQLPFFGGAATRTGNCRYDYFHAYHSVEETKNF